MDANVGVVVPDERKRILLVKNRAEHKELPSGKKFFKPSKWGLPNGRQEPGEEVTTTATRETEEETGYKVEIEPGLKIEGDAEDHRNVTFLGHTIGGRLKAQTDEIIDCRWFPIRVLWDRSFNMYSSHRRRAQQLLKELRKM